MNQIAKEIASYLGSAKLSDEEFLQHYGMPRRSGRYPYGSGKDPYQHSMDFLGRVEMLKKKGWKETPENIKKEFGLSVKQYRMEKSICNDTRRGYLVDKAKRLRDKEGMTPTQIGKEMGVNESTVRGWFNEESESRMRKCKETANMLKEKVDKHPNKMIDVGAETERHLGISREKLDTALYMLEREGYHIYGGRVPQPTNKNQMTTLKVLAGPDVPNSAIYEYDKIGTITDLVSKDGGTTFEKKFTYPSSMDSKRLKIRYREEGGEDKDGIVELRRGVPDLDLQGSRYAQVRILVDGTHYIKGMAVYSDNMPDGVDVVFNTNKSKSVPKMEVLKEIKSDPDNPFGSAIKDADQGGQYWYTDKNGKKKLGLINKRADEGDWSDWADTLPSQFLSKQSKHLAKKQLDLAKANKEAEFDEIMSLTNPTIKKYYLDKFASSCDKAAVDLKAASLPGQKYHVIIPVNSIGDDKIYAPQYKDGTKLALVRYPHGGIFEIPVLTVNNKHAEARKLLGTDIKDAVGITKKVADRLSGADFDGDTVMCIPTDDPKGKVKISRKLELDGLKGFDPKLSYGYDEIKTDSDGTKHYYRAGKEFKPMKEGSKNTEMGVISNLITDMTLFGAPDDELAAAVRHSMVVIDAPKHKLDYKQSERDNNISKLKKEWQVHVREDGSIKYGGAATIVSRSRGEKRVDKRRGEPKTNIKGKPWYDENKPEGSLIYTKADDKDLYFVDSIYDKKTGIKTIKRKNGKDITYNMNSKSDRDKYEPIMTRDSKGNVTYTNRDGSIEYKTRKRTIKSTNMAETDDAMTLVSNPKHPHPMELLYADYANHMKALANRARIEVINTGNLQYNPSATKIYKSEILSLDKKLDDAAKNTVRERAATRLASAEIKRKQEANPDLKGEDLRKVSQRAITKYRSEVGSVSRKQRAITITDKEWEAIQAGAISENKLKKILNHSDADSLRERAMPKERKQFTQAQINRMKRMSESNFTLAEIAEKMHLSPSTVSKYLKGVK